MEQDVIVEIKNVFTDVVTLFEDVLTKVGKVVEQILTHLLGKEVKDLEVEQWSNKQVMTKTFRFLCCEKIKHIKTIIQATLGTRNLQALL